MRVGCRWPTIIALEKHFVGSVATLLNVLSALGFHQALRVMPVIKASGLLSGTTDLVMTHPALAAAIVAHIRGRMSGRVVDPPSVLGLSSSRSHRIWIAIAAKWSRGAIFTIGNSVLTGS